MWVDEGVVVVAREVAAEEDCGHGAGFRVRGSVEKLGEFED